MKLAHVGINDDKNTTVRLSHVNYKYHYQITMELESCKKVIGQQRDQTTYQGSNFTNFTVFAIIQIYGQMPTRL